MPYPYVSAEPLLPILAKHFGVAVYSKALGEKMDQMDKLKDLRDDFVIPKKLNSIRGKYTENRDIQKRNTSKQFQN
jgi:hypothetical protein